MLANRSGSARTHEVKRFWQVLVTASIACMVVAGAPALARTQTVQFGNVSQQCIPDDVIASAAVGADIAPGCTLTQSVVLEEGESLNGVTFSGQWGANTAPASVAGVVRFPDSNSVRVDPLALCGGSACLSPWSNGPEFSSPIDIAGTYQLVLRFEQTAVFTASVLASGLSATADILDAEQPEESDLSVISFEGQAFFTVNEGAGSVSLAVVREGGLDQAVSVTYEAGTDEYDYNASPADFAAGSGTVTFGVGQSRATFTVGITDDELIERSELFYVRLSNPSPDGEISFGNADVQILDNDSPSVVLTESVVTRSESDGFADFYARLVGEFDFGAGNSSEDQSYNYSVGYAVAPGTATEVFGFAGTFTWDEDTARDQRIRVVFPDDIYYEPGGAETASVTLSDPSSGLLLGAPSRSELRITDDETQPEYSIVPGTLRVDESVGTISVDVLRRGDFLENEQLQVTWATEDGTARAVEDYTQASDTIFWNPPQGEVSAAITTTEDVVTVTVAIVDDARYEETENFAIVLSGANPGARIVDGGRTVVTIDDNDPRSQIRFEPGSFEVNESTGTASITITRSGSASGEVAATVTTLDGTATAGEDYTAIAETVVWPDGDTSPRSVSVLIVDDARFEPPPAEYFDVTIQSVSGPGEASGGPARVTVVDDDPRPLVGFSQARYDFDEPAGTVVLQLDRTGSSGGAIAVGYTVIGNTATGGEDYQATSGVVEWGDGDSGSKEIPVTLINDLFYEGATPETFTVELGELPDNVGFSERVATVGIVDDEMRTTVGFADAAVRVREDSGPVRLTVERAGATGGSLSVQYTVEAGSAVAGSDFEASQGVLTWGNGDMTSQEIVVNLVNDNRHEPLPDETFTVRLAGVDGSNDPQIGTNPATVTVEDDDLLTMIGVDPASYQVSEGGEVSVSVVRSGASGGAVGVTLRTVDGTAVAGEDYTASNPSVSWADGESGSRSVTFQTLGDDIFEGPVAEYFTVELGEVQGDAAVDSAASSARVEIEDLDLRTTLQFGSGDITVREDVGELVVSITRENASGGAVSVRVSSEDGSAVAGSDFTATSQVVSWDSGDSSPKEVRLPISSDRSFEQDETFSLVLSAPTGEAGLGTPSRIIVTITEVDEQPVLRFENAAVEFAESAGSATLTVQREFASGDALTVRYSTADGTATAGTHYTASQGVLTWGAGVSGAQEIVVPLLDNMTFDSAAMPQFTVTLSDPSAPAVLGQPSVASVTINEDDTRPSLQFAAGAIEVREQDGSVTVEVTRSGSVGDALSVEFATVEGTATAGSDYVARSGTLQWAAGSGDPQQIVVDLIDNNSFEGTTPETFTVQLSAPSAPAELGAGAELVVSITESQPTPTFSLSADSPQVSETAGSIIVSVDPGVAADTAMSVGFGTADGTATAGSDYEASSGRLEWLPGDSTPKQIEVALLTDDLFEGAAGETFSIALSDVVGPATLAGNSSLVVTITESGMAPVLEFAAGDSAVEEGANSVTVSVTRGQSSGDALTVDYRTVDGTALAGQDYTAATGQLAWAAGDNSPREIVVAILPDDAFEGADGESFSIELSNPLAPAELGSQTTHVVTIAEVSMMPGLDVGNVTVSVSEGAPTAVIEITRTGASAGGISIDYATEDDTATAGVDYIATMGTLSWADGETGAMQITVPLLQDDLFEGASEAFRIVLTNPPAGVTLANSEITVELSETVEVPIVQLDDIEAVVGEDGGMAQINVSLSGLTGDPISVTYTTASDSAVANVDFTPMTGVLTWAADESGVRTIDIPILDDTLFENPIDEVFTVTLSNVTGGAVLGPQMLFTQTIRDNDPRGTGAPVGIAGPDILVRVDDETGLGAFNLVATQSNDFETYEWLTSGELVGNGPSVNLTQPPGEYVYTLRVVDGEGMAFTDDVNVAVTRELVQGARRLEDIEGLNENDRRMARNLDNICGRLNTKVVLTADQEDLRERCSAIILNENTSEVIDALGEINGRQITGQMTSALEFGALQFRNIAGRMRALREGAEGFSVAGLNINVQGKNVPNTLLTGVGSALKGGNAGDEQTYEFGRWGAFVTGNLHFGEKDGTDRETGFDFESGGITAGVDYRATDKLVWGMAVSYATGEADFEDNDGSLDSDGLALTAYGSYATDKYYVDGLMGLGRNSHDSKRVIEYNDALGSVSRVADGDTDGDMFSVGFETGLNLRPGKWLINPNVSAFYTKVDIDGFDESGARGLNLRYDGQGNESLTVSGGAAFSYTFTTDKMVLIPQLRLDYVFELENDGQLINVRFLNDPFANDPDNPSPLIGLRTDDPDDSYINVGVGLSGQFINGFSGYVDWQKVISYDDLDSDSFSFGLRWEKAF